jgi:membrane protease YdiL (CAAX protease family)
MLWKVSGKAALAVVMLLFLNGWVSIPILIIGIAIVGLDAGAGLSPEEWTNQLGALPLLNTFGLALSSAAAILVVWILYSAFERDRSWSLGWGQAHRRKHLSIGLLLGIGWISTGFLLILAMGGVRIAGFAFTPDVGLALMLDLILFIVVGFSEEIFSRGYIYGLVKRHGGIPAAVVVSSLVFALLHSMNAAVFESVFPMLNLVLAGVLLALLREVSGGLWVPIGMHITWNFFQGDVYGMAVSGNQTSSILQLEIVHPFIAGGAFGLEGSFAATLISVAACVVLIGMVRNQRNQRNQNQGIIA